MTIAIERKAVAVEFKARKTKGEFDALFSVFENVDLDGDRIRKGALTEAVENDPNPAVVWTHMWNIPPIGETLDWGQTDAGAKASGRLFVDEHEVAKQVWIGLESKALKQFSFAFHIKEYSLVEPGDGEKTPRFDGKIKEIIAIDHVWEWGPTLLGANPETEMLSNGKSMETLLGIKDYFPNGIIVPRANLSAEQFAAIKAIVEGGDPDVIEQAEEAGAPDKAAVASLMLERPKVHLHS